MASPRAQVLEGRIQRRGYRIERLYVDGVQAIRFIDSRCPAMYFTAHRNTRQTRIQAGMPKRHDEPDITDWAMGEIAHMLGVDY